MCDICASEWKLGITNSVDILISYAPRYYLEFCKEFPGGSAGFFKLPHLHAIDGFFFLNSHFNLHLFYNKIFIY